jgi:hypothetical protein
MAISSVPIYTMCSIKMHATNLHSIDMIRKNVLWRGSDLAGKGKHMVAWKKITTPKDKGGLGLQDLRVMNWLPNICTNSGSTDLKLPLLRWKSTSFSSGQRELLVKGHYEAKRLFQRNNICICRPKRYHTTLG